MAFRLPKALSLLAGIMLLLLFVPGGLQPLAAQELDPGEVAIPPGQEFAPGQLLVRFHPGVSAQQADRVLATQGASRIRRIRTLDVQVLRLPPGLSVERAAQIFSRMPEVEFAEPNYILRIQAPAAEVTDQWGLNQIQAPEAWAVIEAPNPDPDPALIAVVDTGIDRNHPDLADNIWTQPDGTWGWDFVNNDNDPFDDHMHGTMVSSVAAGVKDGSGVAGVCPWCQLMAVKVLDANGSGYLDTVATGITYAADMGADVINLSLGAGEGSQTLADAVDYAWGQGVLVVAAAGNDGTETLFYPAAYANAMAVASTNGYDQRSCFSNYGQGYISVAAPGEEVTGALPGGGQGAGSGTSLAAPHVSGLGGLLFSQDANRSNADVRSLIEATTNDLGPEGSDAYFGTGRINAYRAVTDNRNPTPPPGEGGISTSDADTSGYAHARKLARDGGNTVHLAWHGKSGGQYQVLYATSTNDRGDWTPPQVVFESSAETYHPALAVHGNYVYIAFPSMHDSAKYRVWFTRKALGDTAWDTPTAVIADSSSDAVRPDLYVDPANGRLHLVAATDVPQGDMLPQCRNDAPYVYYTWSGNGGDSWSDAVTVTAPTGAKCTRYADVHANNDNVYIASRSVEWTILNIVPHYRLFRVRSTDGGNTWIDRTELVGHDGWFTGEYGASLAGVEDQLYLSYEHNGAIYLQQSSPDGSTWSTAQNVGAGAWPSITQAGDGPWLLWTAGGNLMLRHYNGTGWEPAENLGGGNFPNLKLGTNGSRLEWVSTQSSCAPFRMAYDWRTLDENYLPTDTPTPTPTPSNTPTPTDTPTPTNTPTPTPTPTPTSTPTPTDTSTPTPTSTNTPTPTDTPTPTNTPAPMHVEGIYMLMVHAGGPNNRAEATVTIWDNTDTPVSGATVHGDFSGDSSGNDSGTTDAYGQVTLRSPSVKKGSNWEFCVVSVIKGGYTYEPSKNVKTCDTTGTLQPPDTPTPTPPSGADPIHVSDLIGSSSLGNRNRWNAQVTITIHGAQGESEVAVAGATVSGQWSGGTTGSDSCLTDGSGQCSVTKSNIKADQSSVIFTVTDVTQVSYFYSPDYNHVTSIVISSP